jgi:hypothetical protein
MLWSSIGGYHCSRETHSWHLQGLLSSSTLKMETSSSKMLISNYEKTCSQEPKITMQIFAKKTPNLRHAAIFHMATAM